MKNNTSSLNKISSIAFIVGLVIVVALGVMNALYSEPMDENFLSEYDEFDQWEEVSTEPVVYKVANEGQEVGYLVLESHYGYQSDVAIATLVGMDGTVLNVNTYYQNETPSYYRKLISGGFFSKNYVGENIEDGFSINTNVDAISHATISSNAVTRAVEDGVSFVGHEYLDVQVQDPDGGSIKFGKNEFILIGMFVLALLASRMKKVKWLRWLVRAYAVIMMGFIAAQFITLSVLAAFFTFDWPSIQDYPRWYIMIFGVLILLIATGRNYYCSYMCPFGAVQEMESALAGSLGSKRINPSIAKYLRLTPGILVFIALVLAFATHNLAVLNYEPFSLLFGQVGVGIQWALLPIVLIASLFFNRFYCRYVCPVGYIMTKLIKFRHKVVSKVWPKKKPSKAKAN